MTKSRIFLFCLLAFIIGVGVRSVAVPPLTVLWAGSLCGGMALMAGLLHRSKKVAVYGLVLVLFLGGILRFEYEVRSRPNLEPLYGTRAALHGIIRDDPVRDTKTQRLNVRIENINGKPITESFTLLVTAKPYPQYKIGDALTVVGAVDRPENFSGDFDYVSYLAKDRIFAVTAFPTIEKTGEGQRNRVIMALSRLKHAFEANIDHMLPEPHGAFLQGLLLGERSSLPDDLVTDFRKTGTTHIIALSGYNITVVSGSLMEVLLLLTVPFFTAFWAAAAGIVLFIFLAGGSASLIRAGVMGMLVLIAQREGRVYNIRNALAFAGFVMIAANPMILRYDTGFQLSFLATLGLIYLSPRVEHGLESGWYRLSVMLGNRKAPSIIREDVEPSFARNLLHKVKRIFVETLSAQLAVLPALVYTFGNISLVSPFANLFVLLAIPYAMGLGFAAGIVGFLSGPASRIAALPAWLLLEYVLRTIAFFAGFPYASL